MSDSRTEKAIKNIVFSFLSQLLTLILAFVSRNCFIRYFGVEFLGLNGLFSDVLGLLSMADLGFAIAMVYSFYEPLANHDEEKLAGLVTFYKKVYMFVATAVLLIGLLLLPLLPYIIKTETSIPRVKFYYLISLLNVVFSYLWVYRTAILTADQQEYRLKKVSMFISTLSTAVQISVMYFTRSYVIYLMISTVFSILNNIIASRLAVRLYPYITKNISISKEEKILIFKNMGSVFLFKISNVLINATDNILISTLLGTAIVGYYSNYSLIQRQLLTFYSLLFTSMTASIGNMVVQESREKRYRIFDSQQSLSFVICLFLVPCFALLADDFITIWLGKEYCLDNMTMMAICMNMYLACVLQPLWTYREATGLFKKTKWIMLICAVINLILSVLLGKLMGLSGILFASAFSRLLTYVWYEPRILFREYFGISSRKYYLNIAKNFVVILIVLGVGNELSSVIKVNSLLDWIIKASIIGSFSMGFSLFVYRKSQGLSIIFEKIRLMVKL